jgi:predicted RNA-binding protein associated with RNAse of E/G family
LTGEPVLIHYRRPPDDTRVFRQSLVTRLPDCVVTLLAEAPVPRPVVAGGETILEPGAPVVWFTYPGRWYDIGRFHLGDGTFTGLYANVLTPVRMEGNVWETTDLFLDVWLPAAGPPEILDADEFDHALDAGWLDGEIAARARQTALSLAAAAAVGRWPPSHVTDWTLEAALHRLGGEGAAPELS